MLDVTAALAQSLANCFGPEILLTAEQQAQILAVYDGDCIDPEANFEAIEAIVGGDAVEAVCIAIEWA